MTPVPLIAELLQAAESGAERLAAAEDGLEDVALLLHALQPS